LPFLTDTHCHLYLQEFSDDLEDVLNRAISEGVKRILVPGIDLETCQQSLRLSEKYPGFLFSAIGIHPNNTAGFEHKNFKNFEELLNLSNVLAIGEIGLDFYREKSPIADQISIFNIMLNFSRLCGKPVCIHNRDADNKIIEILDLWYSKIKESNSALADHPGVFHSFNGSEVISRWALTHNFYLGIGGPITFPKNRNFQKMIEDIDIDHLLIETDSPFLSPQLYRGKRNEPSNVKFVAEKISEIKRMDILEVITRTNENAKSLLGW
jgi:TatD DNase family protein